MFVVDTIPLQLPIVIVHIYLKGTHLFTFVLPILFPIPLLSLSPCPPPPSDTADNVIIVLPR